MIPEAVWYNRCAPQALYAFGEHHALGYSPFACNKIKHPHPIMDAYKFLGSFNEMLLQDNCEIRTAGFYQQEKYEEFLISLKNLFLNVKTSEIQDIPAGGLIAALSDHDFIVAGWNAEIDFATNNSGISNIEFIYLETGEIKGGDWVSGQRLNGDETYHGKTVILGEKFTCCRVQLNMNLVPLTHQTSWTFAS